MRDSERYMAQADAVVRMAARAQSPAEKAVYETIAQGWRKLAGEARRNEQHEEAPLPPGEARRYRAANSG